MYRYVMDTGYMFIHNVNCRSKSNMSIMFYDCYFVNSHTHAFSMFMIEYTNTVAFLLLKNHAYGKKSYNKCLLDIEIHNNILIQKLIILIQNKRIKPNCVNNVSV